MDGIARPTILSRSRYPKDTSYMHESPQPSGKNITKASLKRASSRKDKVLRFSQKSILITFRSTEAKRKAYTEAAKLLKTKISTELRKSLEQLLYRAAMARRELMSRALELRICPDKLCGKKGGVMVDLDGKWRCQECGAHGTSSPFSMEPGQESQSTS